MTGGKNILTLLGIIVIFPWVSGFHTPATLARGFVTQDHRQINTPPVPKLARSRSTHCAVDPSQFVDAAVVSGTFWSVIRGKIISIAIGNAAAGVVIIFVARFVGDMIAKSRDELFDRGNKKGAAAVEAAKQKMNWEKPVSVGSLSDASPNSDALVRLAICIFIDLAGDASMAIPFLGGASDFILAPIEALTLRQLFGSNSVAGIELIKELLPFDIIPAATICWVIEELYPHSFLAEKLKLGKWSKVRGENNVTGK